jgi:hypothetical protein
MNQSTTLSWSPVKMTESTIQRRTEQLIAEIKVHPHKEELLQLMYEQRLDAMLDEYTTILN